MSEVVRLENLGRLTWTECGIDQLKHPLYIDVYSIIFSCSKKDCGLGLGIGQFKILDDIIQSQAL